MPLSMDSRLRNFRADRRTSAEDALPSLVRDVLGGAEMTGEAGTCYVIRRTYREKIALPPCEPERLRRNLRLLRGVGPRTEERLRGLGIDDLEQLAEHDRWSGQAREILQDITVRDVRRLKRRGVQDRDVLSLLLPADLVFVDIETTGLYNVLPLFLVGLLYADGDELHLVQYLARRFEEERPVLAAVVAEFSRFKTIVSYNGRAFDVPYLTGRCLAQRVSCRLEHVHIDLLCHVRRKYRGRLPDCRLATVEGALLCRGPRTDDTPGHLIPDLYHYFVKTQDQEIIRGIIEHNAQDLLALARLLPLVE
ncbi:MAG: ribonuclease H-like domain-containing protein [Bacteroidota bacterium]